MTPNQDFPEKMMYKLRRMNKAEDEGEENSKKREQRKDLEPKDTILLVQKS